MEIEIGLQPKRFTNYIEGMIILDLMDLMEIKYNYRIQTPHLKIIRISLSPLTLLLGDYLERERERERERENLLREESRS